MAEGVVPEPRVVAVSRSSTHGPGKDNQSAITLVAGLGIEDDVHAGATVKHRSRRRKNPEIPNLRQIHLMHSELFSELAAKGFEIAPGEMGENVTTSGLDLLSLPEGTRMRLGEEAEIELTGLRNPCKQLEGVAPGLMKATLDRDESGALVRKAGVMGVVLAGGVVSPGDPIVVIEPDGPRTPLKPV